MLLKGQGLTIERPQRTLGALVAALPALAALSLAAALTVQASDWPISWPRFIAYVSAAGLVLLALLFAFWSYACTTLHYIVDRNGLTIAWGPIKHIIPFDTVRDLVHGRGEHRPRVGGLSWWGHHVGRGLAQGLGEALFFSTHSSPEELVYVRTAAATYALNPRDPARFIAQVRRYQQAVSLGRPASRADQSVQRNALAAHPIWVDHVAQWLTAMAVIINLALWGYLSAVYPDLAPQITIEFPPLGDITDLNSRLHIFKVPATATAVLALNLAVALGFHWRERAATYLLLSATVFFQLLFWVAAGITIANA